MEYDENDELEVAGGFTASFEVNEYNSVEVKPWRLVEVEDRCEGSISTRVYARYAKACGLFAVFLRVLFFGVMQLCKMASDFWLSKWSEFNREKRPNTSANDIQASNWYYLLIYAAISMANVVFALVANLCAQLTTVRATRPLHDNMLER